MIMPSIRFPEYNGKWEKKKLSEVSNIGRGKSKHRPRNASFLYGGKYPFLQTGDIREAGLYISQYTQTYSESGLRQSKLWNENTLCITIAANIAETSILKIKACFPDSIIGLIPKENETTVLFVKYLFDKFKIEIQKLSQGAAQDNLNQDRLSKIEFVFPTLCEQTKITDFLIAVDEKLSALKQKKNLLNQYKKGVMQKIFSQELRFKDDNGNEFADWEDKPMNEFLFEHKLKSTGNEEVFSVSVHKGLINQIEHLGRSFSAKNTDNYNLVQPFDIVYTKSPTGDFPLGIVKQSKIAQSVIVSPLYGIFRPQSKGLGYMLNVYFESPLNTSNYLGSLIQKGAKNTINITNTTFLSKSMSLPSSLIEQDKIGDFLSTIDEKINHCQKQITHTERYKKGLLQQMFV